MAALAGNALLISKIFTATQAIATLSQTLGAASGLLAQVHAENREVSQAELDSVFLKDSDSMRRLDEHLKALGA